MALVRYFAFSDIPVLGNGYKIKEIVCCHDMDSDRYMTVCLWLCLPCALLLHSFRICYSHLFVNCDCDNGASCLVRLDGWLVSRHVCTSKA